MHASKFYPAPQNPRQLNTNKKGESGRPDVEKGNRIVSLTDHSPSVKRIVLDEEKQQSNELSAPPAERLIYDFRSKSDENTKIFHSAPTQCREGNSRIRNNTFDMNEFSKIFTGVACLICVLVLVTVYFSLEQVKANGFAARNVTDPEI